VSVSSPFLDAGLVITEYPLFLGFIKGNPPLRCVRVKADEVCCTLTLNTHCGLTPRAQATIQCFTAFPSLRTIEIECADGQRPANMAHLVQVAKDALHACIEYKPTSKSKKTRKGQTNTQDAQEDLVDLYTDTRMVKVRHLSTQVNHYSVQPASNYQPNRIEEFLI
jgi:hypothetical protein